LLISLYFWENPHGMKTQNKVVCLAHCAWKHWHCCC